MKIALFLSIGLLITTLSGCAFIERLTDRSASVAARGIEGYCHLSEADRAKFREKVNNRLAERGSTASVLIDC